MNTPTTHRIARAYLYGLYSGELPALDNLVATIDCTSPDTLTQDGFLRGATMQRVLRVLEDSTLLHDLYDVTYVDETGRPIRRERWDSVLSYSNRAVIIANGGQLAQVTSTRAYRPLERLAPLAIPAF